MACKERAEEVSTYKSFNGKDYVICVYTYNYKDTKDVMRIRNQLRKLGIVKKNSI